nr:MAG: hypothetical protein DIU70_13490 [Bacillota bacterium]
MFDLEDWLRLLQDWRYFAEGLGQTVKASGLALLLALGIGVVVGVLSVAPWTPVRRLTRVYVEFFQNTPLVVHAFFLYYGLPHLGISLPVLAVGVLALGVYTGAYISEVIRAGIQSIHRGQLGGGYSQGFTYPRLL